MRWQLRNMDGLHDVFATLLLCVKFQIIIAHLWIYPRTLFFYTHMPYRVLQNACCAINFVLVVWRVKILGDNTQNITCLRHNWQVWDYISEYVNASKPLSFNKTKWGFALSQAVIYALIWYHRKNITFSRQYQFLCMKTTHRYMRMIDMSNKAVII